MIDRSCGTTSAIISGGSPAREAEAKVRTIYTRIELMFAPCATLESVYAVKETWILHHHTVCNEPVRDHPDFLRPWMNEENKRQQGNEPGQFEYLLECA